ncbi:MULTISPECIES: hypothetical protein [unclassified Rhizobium]
MTGSLRDTRPKIGFVSDPAVMPDEVGPRQIRERPTDGDGARQIGNPAW